MYINKNIINYIRIIIMIIIFEKNLHTLLKIFTIVKNKNLNCPILCYFYLFFNQIYIVFLVVNKD